MRVVWFPEPFPQIGQPLRWRHPRMAFALGWFHVYGPGPFEVAAVLDRPEQGLPLALLVNTECGPREIDAAWLGPAVAPRRTPSADGAPQRV
jgi:hypothetical protein